MMLRMIDDYERTDFHDGFVIVRSEKSACKKKSPRLARADYMVEQAKRRLQFHLGLSRVTGATELACACLGNYCFD